MFLFIQYFSSIKVFFLELAVFRNQFIVLPAGRNFVWSRETGTSELRGSSERLRP